MSNQKYTEEFKAEAIKQVTEHGYKVREVSVQNESGDHKLQTQHEP